MTARRMTSSCGELFDELEFRQLAARVLGGRHHPPRLQPFATGAGKRRLARQTALFGSPGCYRSLAEDAEEDENLPLPRTAAALNADAAPPVPPHRYAGAAPDAC